MQLSEAIISVKNFIPSSVNTEDSELKLIEKAELKNEQVKTVLEMIKLNKFIIVFSFFFIEAFTGIF